MSLIVMLLTCVFFLHVSQRKEPQMIGHIMIHEEIRKDVRPANSVIHVIMDSDQYRARQLNFLAHVLHG